MADQNSNSPFLNQPAELRVAVYQYLVPSTGSPPDRLHHTRLINRQTKEEYEREMIEDIKKHHADLIKRFSYIQPEIRAPTDYASTKELHLTITYSKIDPTAEGLSGFLDNILLALDPHIDYVYVNYINDGTDAADAADATLTGNRRRRARPDLSTICSNINMYFKCMKFPENRMRDHRALMRVEVRYNDGEVLSTQHAMLAVEIDRYDHWYKHLVCDADGRNPRAIVWKLQTPPPRAEENWTQVLAPRTRTEQIFASLRRR
ncbi:hypothetical protein BDV95DRAFT_612339 [Massariosphaeria phaeospora]|uniref:Uncharacterized protein n=1 Tax=Massariosphaeria phaeospora TaxID=100035 RepID=A0A7C8M7H3_9PLEO|nr:hypothetical protein BDV95DRAFT_612339 [Massariosphaeria phaeospora]